MPVPKIRFEDSGMSVRTREAGRSNPSTSMERPRARKTACVSPRRVYREWIIEGGAMVESQIHTTAVDRNVQDPVSQAIAGTVTNRHRTVSVINILVARRHLFQDERPQAQR